MRCGPRVPVDFAGELFEMHFDDREAENFKVRRSLVDLLPNQVEEVTLALSEGHACRDVLQQWHDTQSFFNVLLDSRGNPTTQSLSAVCVRRQQLVFEVVNRLQHAVSRHAHSIGVFVFCADMHVVTQELFQVSHG